MKADAVNDMFGKNELISKAFWTLFVVMAGLMMTR